MTTAEQLLRTWRESHSYCVKGTPQGVCNKCRMTDDYLSSSESKESAAGQEGGAGGCALFYRHNNVHWATADHAVSGDVR